VNVWTNPVPGAVHVMYACGLRASDQAPYGIELLIGYGFLRFVRARSLLRC
jgi:hypothetical protein